MSTHDPATDPPGAVSSQNHEEAQSGHRDDHTHPEPRTRQEQAKPDHAGQKSPAADTEQSAADRDTPKDVKPESDDS